MFIPGRIEVLGKHTDYCGGQSIVCATERGFRADVEAQSDSILHIENRDSGEAVSLDLSLPVSPAGHWSNYAAEVVRRVGKNFRSKALRGLNLRFSSDLPKAAGLSSSSALITMVFAAITDVNELRAFPEFKNNIFNDLDLAEYLGCLENGQTFRGLSGSAGIGTFGGSQDHAAILLCKQNQLSLFSFVPLRGEGEIQMPADLTFVVAASGVIAEKTGNAKERFNRLSRMAAEIVNGLGGRSLSELADRFGPDEMRDRIKTVESGFTTEALIRRFDQFFAESFAFIPAFVRALSSGAYDEVGEIVDRSQLTAESGLANQVAETTFLQRSAREIGAIAASAFGAGFGGSVYAIVRASDAAAFKNEWRSRYSAAFPTHGRVSEFFTTSPSAILL